jgi:inner membrane protein
MLLRTHLVFSVFLYFLLIEYLSFSFVFVAFVLFGTMFVDIDSRKSKFGKFFLFRPLQWFVSHRGAFHTLLGGMVLSGLIYFFNKNAGMGFGFGYLSHLFLDMLTVQGIALFRPLTKKKIGFGLRTGGLIEEIIFVLLLLADVYLFFRVVF